jgi:acyl carrier protein
MTTTDELFPEIARILSEALNIDEDQITPDSTLRGDLGAESIDILDITFRLEREFGVTVRRHELFPDHIFEGSVEHIANGKITEEGIAKMKAALPHSNFAEFEKDPTNENIMLLFTVNTLVKYMRHKLRKAPCPV